MTENSREFREEVARHLGHPTYEALIDSIHDRGLDADDYFMEMLKQSFGIVIKREETISRLEDLNKNLLIDIGNRPVAKNDYKIVIRKDGKLVSATTPDCGHILNIVKDSVQFEQTTWEKAFGRTRVKFEVFVKDSSIEIQS